MKFFIIILVFLTGCSKLYTVTPYYGDKELYGCAIESNGLGRDYLFLDKDVNKVNEFCEKTRDKK